MSKLACLPRKTLKQYVTGWIEPEESAAIEEHLQNCELCEQTIHELERDPDTLVEFVRSSNKPESRGHDELGAVADYALSRAKEIGAAEVPIDTAIDAADQSLEPSTSQEVGPYQLLQPLGHGGMGAVYLARHRQLGKQVAIKLLPARAFRNDLYTARFQREIRAAGSLNHPSIINATDAGQHGSTHYLVMEYIDGLDLSRIARMAGRLSIADASAVMHAVALGLSHAHAAGIVHRDIKPSNLMISRCGQVKILDFGLAQVTLWDEASAELTTVGQLMGTIDYMAPEQAERADMVDYRADLYSMGATLFRMLCGRAPLAATPDLSPLAKLRLLATSQPPNLSTLREDAPQALCQLVDSLLSRDPAARPASAAHVAEQLAQFTAGADLPALVAGALTRQESSPDRITTTSAAHDLLGRSVEFQSAAGFSGRARRWLTFAALAPLFILAGVLITLETQKGQLIIESTDANVAVQLVKGGRVYKTVSVVPGINTTRVYAGTYEVVIDAGSDRFELDEDRIDVKRGDSVIAKLRTKPSNPTTVQKETTAQSTVLPVPPVPDVTLADETIYDGKPLAYWLEKFARERSPTAIQQALQAISALVNPSNAEQITQTLLSGLPQLDAQHDSRTFKLVLDAQNNGKQYIDQLVRSLSAGDERWAARVLTAGVYAYTQSSKLPPDTERTESLLPLIDWVEENGFGPDSDGLLLPAARFFGFQLNTGNLNRKIEDQLLDRLVSDRRLGAEFWLSELPRFSGDRYAPWNNPRYASAVEFKAVERFIDEKSPPKDVARAAMLLTVLNGPLYNRAGMQSLPRADRLHAALARRLHQFSENPESVSEVIPVEQSFASEAIPRISEASLFGVKMVVNGGSGEAACLLAYELLDLVERLAPCESCLEEVRALYRGLLPAATEFVLELLDNPFSEIPHVRMAVKWPSMSGTISRPRASSPKTFEPRAQIATFVFVRAESVLPEKERPSVNEQVRFIKKRWIEQRMQELDTDNDGQLSIQEAQPEIKQPETADTDQNGHISAEEFFNSLENWGK